MPKSIQLDPVTAARMRSAREWNEVNKINAARVPECVTLNDASVNPTPLPAVITSKVRDGAEVVLPNVVAAQAAPPAAHAPVVPTSRPCVLVNLTSLFGFAPSIIKNSVYTSQLETFRSQVTKTLEENWEFGIEELFELEVAMHCEEILADATMGSMPSECQISLPYPKTIEKRK
eukprot:CAMPEP_0182514640 /NCGR_PEP_ID=MMETSP1321-20130603/36169_1 /TAXON_ID=91990 /ORGANISM="Bolidomonas sp., Strain RCC1657" /LENGTH=174 /DNA_ID=CAMNT_0024721881 /DNA_START=55 /DNA_END=576 /DNA_ORIENTATION=-